MLFAKMKKKKMGKLVRSFKYFEPKCTFLNNTQNHFLQNWGSCGIGQVLLMSLVTTGSIVIWRCHLFVLLVVQQVTVQSLVKCS